MTFVRRKMRVQIDRPGAQLVLSDFRMSATIEHAGGASNGQLFLTIWGLKLDTMLGLATYGVKQNVVTNRKITLEAGDESGYTTAFVGSILSATGDFNAAPDVGFHIVAHCVLAQAVAPSKPTVFRGSVDVATIMAGLAEQLGLRFENSGVDNRLINPSFDGSALSQMRQCADAANINANVIDGVLAIWPKWSSRGGLVPVLSADTGMVGYPTFNAMGLSAKSIYLPTTGLGQQIEVRSSIVATARYTVYNLVHELDCELPNGKWFTTIDAYTPNVPQRPPAAV